MGDDSVVGDGVVVVRVVEMRVVLVVELVLIVVMMVMVAGLHSYQTLRSFS